MAQLTEADKIAFRKLTESGWESCPEEQSPRFVEPTAEGRARYIRWASEAAKFFKGTKPVDFSGDHWKL
jgi:hypothetical protein